ncbi:helicase-related protein [Streptomyces sp. M10(2022)]
MVFSERIPTLRWLAETVPAALGFPHGTSPDESKPWLGYGGAVQVMHGEASSDEEQRAIVEKFGLRDDPVRILFTGDVASEGVNLHQQCHLLVHYDLPWSLIRIEQRNGRIDRYGQAYPPQFRALVLTSDIPWRTDTVSGQPRTLDDRLVGEKLLGREEEAHKIEGSAEAVTGLYRAQEEENRLTQDLIAGRTVEESIKQSQQGGAAFLAGLLGQVGAVPEHPEVPRAVVPTLFRSTADYFDEALRQVCHPNPEDQLSLRRDDDGTIAFEPRATCSTGSRRCPSRTWTSSGSCPARPNRDDYASPSPRTSPMRVSRPRGRPPSPSGPTSLTSRTSTRSWTGSPTRSSSRSAVTRPRCSPPPWTVPPSWCRASIPMARVGPPSWSGWPSPACPGSRTRWS